MFCQKEEIDHVLGNHRGARDHLVSTFLFTLNELQGIMLIVRRFRSKKQRTFYPRNFRFSFFFFQFCSDV